MNKSLLFIAFLIFGISCSEPENKADLSTLSTALEKQKQYFYSVEYNLIQNNSGRESSVYGLVSLNRNKNSGISNAYFGSSEDNLNGSLQSIYLDKDWTHILNSNKFDRSAAGFLLDSLHSPVLFNASLITKIGEDARKIKMENVQPNIIKWTVDISNKPDQLVLVWNQDLEQLLSLEYQYDYLSSNKVTRKWSFNYLAEAEYQNLKKEHELHLQRAQQPFL